MRKLTLLLTALLAVLAGCQKVENSKPRYNKDACVVCSPIGHETEAGKCTYCKASSKCQFCKGTGKRLEGKKDSYYEAVCAFCGGGGKCHYCSGTGKCGICKGTGKYVPFPSGKGETPAPDSLSQGGGK